MMDNSKEKISEDVQRLKKEVRRSWWEDGIMEILWSIWFLLPASGVIIINFYKQPPYLGFIALAMIVVGAFTPLIFWKYFKERYSWIKVGYAIPLFDYTFSSILTVGMAILAFFGSIFLPEEFYGILFGLSVFFILLSIYFASGFKRFLVISAIPLIVGVTLSILDVFPKEIWSYIIFYPTGIALLISGLKVFRNFVRSHDE